MPSGLFGKYFGEKLGGREGRKKDGKREKARGELSKV